jgi:hypothetical protein
LLSATGAALSGFVLAVVVSVPTAACEGPARHTKIPVASINAERPVALIIIWQSPHLPVPKRNETLTRVHSGAKKGNLRASPGEKGATASRRTSRLRSRLPEIVAEIWAGASQTDRCYEPSGENSAVAIPDRGTPFTACEKQSITIS